MEMPRPGTAFLRPASSSIGSKRSVAFGSSQPHNLGVCAIGSYRWSGIDVHLVQQQVLSGPAWHRLSSNLPMLSVVVNEIGGRCQPRLTIDGAGNERSPAKRNGPISPIS